ncbi:MAG: hypothetical protein OMOMHJEC_00743 [Xanthomonadales bacterium]|nr:hypothetical protein [Xanthomonadales bacterium]
MPDQDIFAGGNDDAIRNSGIYELALAQKVAGQAQPTLERQDFK